MICGEFTITISLANSLPRRLFHIPPLSCQKVHNSILSATVKRQIEGAVST